MNFIPIFPLSVAPYPGKVMALNIFEDRYKQLINDCISTKKPFGIPMIAKGNLENIGMLVSINQIRNVFEDGRMQISVRGEKIFHTLEIIEAMPDKLYQGAIVKYPHNDRRPQPALFNSTNILLHRLFDLSNMAYPVEGNSDSSLSYDIADFAGFTLDQKIAFMSLLKEDQRLEYIRQHLMKVVPLIENSVIISDVMKQKGFSLDNFSLN